MKSIKIIAVLAALCLAAWADSRVDRVAGAVDQRYNHLSTLQVQFTESYRGGGMEREESGTLWLKRPGKMRWAYDKPRDKVFVSDGKQAYFYVPGEAQATHASASKLDDLRSPLRYLLGKTNLAREFSGLSVARDVAPIQAGDVVLRGVPKSMDNVEEVLLEITPDAHIGRIVIDEVDGSVTEFRFRDPKENIPVSDALFHFSPPPGVAVVEGTTLAF